MIYVLIGLGTVGLVLFIWRYPKKQMKKIEDIKPEERWKAENEFRKTIIQIVGGLIVIAGLFFAWEELSQSRELLKQSHEEFLQSQENMKAGQISSRFSQAITLLSQEGATNRIGAIYALEQIAKESHNYLQTVLDILTSFVKNSEYFDQPVKEKEDKKSIAVKLEVELKKIDEDLAWRSQKKRGEISKIFNKIKILSEVQVALSVIGRIRKEVIEMSYQNIVEENESGEKIGDDQRILDGIEEKIARYRINLSESILIQADFSKADLRGAELSMADLRGVSFYGAILKRANFQGAKLQYAYFGQADLQFIVLSRADLRESNLWGARLQGAFLQSADLRGVKIHRVKLCGADLQWAKLQKAELFMADLRGAKLWKANLQNANFQGANLSGVDLRETNLQGANFQEANLQEAFLSDIEENAINMLLKVKSLHGVEGLDPKIEEELRRRKPELFEKPKSD
jgi:uncharacterized protein YjbI with pentapeptide repeats